MNKKDPDTNAVDDFAAANTNRIDIEESTSSTTTAPPYSVSTETGTPAVFSFRQSSKFGLSENLSENFATSRKKHTNNRKCLVNKNQDDKDSASPNANIENVLSGSINCSSCKSSPSVFTQEKSQNPNKTVIGTSVLPNSSKCFFSEPLPKTNLVLNSNIQSDKGVRDILSENKKLPNIQSTLESPQNLQTRFKHSHKTQESLSRFHMHSADDVLSVISEESLINSTTRNGGLNSELNRSEVIQSKSRTGRVSHTNSTEELQDPWVRPSNMICTTPDVSTLNCHSNPTRSTCQHDAAQQTTPTARNRTRIRFQSESRDELEDIETKTRINRNKSFVRGRSQNESDNRERERNDIDLLSRPSWCDAKFALSRIEQVIIFFGHCIKVVPSYQSLEFSFK